MSANIFINAHFFPNTSKNYNYFTLAYKVEIE